MRSVVMVSSVVIPLAYQKIHNFKNFSANGQSIMLKKFKFNFLWKYVSVSLLLIYVTVTQPVQANFFTVTSLGDGVDAIIGNGVCATAGGDCTLRAAIQEANATAGMDTISIAITGTIVLGGAVNENASASGDLDITDSVEIEATSNISNIIDGGTNDRIFHIIGSVSVTITGVTLQNGKTSNLSGDGYGGAILNGGSLTIVDSVLKNNTATLYGGAIQNNPNATLRLTNTVVDGNTAGTRGGGISNSEISTGSAGSVTLIDSVVIQNRSNTGSGGGIYNNGTLTIKNTTIAENQAKINGGGIYNNLNMDGLEGSTLSGNGAEQNGGALYNKKTANLTNVTISGNLASVNGGGIFNQPAIGGALQLLNVTLASNTATGTGGGIYNAGASSTQNTIFSQNTSANCVLSSVSNIIVSLGNNLDSGASCGLAGSGDISNSNALLGLLANNGGLTKTHALLNGSPAINSGNNTACPSLDQRGVTRPQGTQCDIGAYETAQTDLKLSKSAAPEPVLAGDQLTYTLLVENIGSAPAVNLTLTDTLPSGTTYQSFSGTGWSCTQPTAGSVTCSKANLSAGDSSTVLIVVSAPNSEGTITNHASITSETSESVTNNNSANIDTTVQGVADLAIVDITDTPDPIYTGNQLVYQVSVANLVPSTANVVNLVTTLPSGSVYGSANGVGWTCSEVGGVVTCTRSTMAVGSAPVVNLQITTPADFEILTLNSELSSATFDSDNSNNSASETTANTAHAELSITGSVSPNPVYANQDLTYTLNVKNAGPNPAVNATVTFNLPWLQSGFLYREWLDMHHQCWHINL
jgi:uncharacterized repeat protein (TIGR01451 family)/CSLREA domain-containing protein